MKLKRLSIGLVFALFTLHLLTLSILLPTTIQAWPNPSSVSAEHPERMTTRYQHYWAIYHCTQGGQAVRGQYSNISTADLREGQIFFNRNYRTNHLSTSGNNSNNSCESNARALLSWGGIRPGDGDGILQFFTQQQTIDGRTFPAMYVSAGEGTGEYRLNDDVSNSSSDSDVFDMIAAQFSAHRPDINFSNTTMPGYAQYFIARDTFFEACEDGVDPVGGMTIRVINSDGTELEDPANKFIVDTSDEGWFRTGHHVGYGMGSRSADDRRQGSTLYCNSIADRMNASAGDALLAINSYLEENPDADPPGEERGDAEDTGPTCEEAGGMAWLFCGLLRVVSQGLDFIDGQMTSLLAMDPDFFRDSSLESAWAVLRNIAYALLVPAMLVMIISTALGFEFVSAYTVKTALPRMVAATIFIALSYEITTFIVDIIQSVGFGVHNILLAPFEASHGLTSNSTLISVVPLPEGGAGRTGLTAIAGWGAIAAGSAVFGGGLIATLAGFAGLAALALLVVLVLLLLRQTLIVLLVLVSPLAIIAWIFPGRTTVWNVWNKTFWLMMWFFPIIMATTAVGKIMAVLIRDGPNIL